MSNDSTNIKPNVPLSYQFGYLAELQDFGPSFVAMCELLKEKNKENIGNLKQLQHTINSGTKSICL